MPPQLILPLIFVVVASVGWYVSTYNKFIKYKNRIEEAWSSIDVALKRRLNLIPNLVRVIEEYGRHESQLLKREEASLSEAGSSRERREGEQRLSLGLRGALALAEAFPDLKASENFLELQKQLDEIEEEIQQQRTLYNAMVGRFNTMVESIPSQWIARRYGFTRQAYFTLDPEDTRETPRINFSQAEER